MIKAKTALVIGGSTGIGAATARLLASSGARTIVAAPIPVTHMRELCEEIQNGGGIASARYCDVCDRAGVQSLFDTIIGEFGRIDIVVNSAGVFFPTPAFVPNADQVEALIRVNFVGGINVIHSALNAMKSTGGGVIVSVTSTQAVLAEPGCSVYAATKAGMAHFVASLAPELKNTGIRIVCVAPGGTRTPMTAAFHQSAAPEVKALIEQLNKTEGGPYGELFLEPEHVAQIINFIVSDAARAIHATSLVADQGHASALPGMPGLDLSKS
jgi:NAD(P)-dependent dehydrogenase (short-subunit alcohol dehydrogenase family)